MPPPRQTLPTVAPPQPAQPQLAQPIPNQLGSSSSAASNGSFGPLNTPFKRLGALPETMNWAGNWSSSVTYFKNDVAYDTLAQGSYVLLITSKTGGSAPGSDPTNWQRLNPATAGGDITAVLTPSGSGLSGGATSGDVTLQNTGVLALTQGTGISITGGQDNKTIANTGVLALTQGTGISITGDQPNKTIAVAASSVTPGSYTNATITVDSVGRVTSAANGSAGGTITAVNTPVGSGLVGGGTSGSLTLYYDLPSMTASLVTPVTLSSTSYVDILNLTFTTALFGASVLILAESTIQNSSLTDSNNVGFLLSVTSGTASFTSSPIEYFSPIIPRLSGVSPSMFVSSQRVTPLICTAAGSYTVRIQAKAMVVPPASTLSVFRTTLIACVGPIA